MFINKQQQKSTIHIFTFTLQFTYKKRKHKGIMKSVEQQTKTGEG